MKITETNPQNTPKIIPSSSSILATQIDPNSIVDPANRNTVATPQNLRTGAPASQEPKTQISPQKSQDAGTLGSTTGASQAKTPPSINSANPASQSGVINNSTGAPHSQSPNTVSGDKTPAQNNHNGPSKPEAPKAEPVSAQPPAATAATSNPQAKPRPPLTSTIPGYSKVVQSPAQHVPQKHNVQSLLNVVTKINKEELSIADTALNLAKSKLKENEAAEPKKIYDKKPKDDTDYIAKMREQVKEFEGFPTDVQEKIYTYLRFAKYEQDYLRRKPVKVTLTKAEFTRIAEISKKLGYDNARVIRNLAFAPSGEAMLVKMQEIADELSRIGNNLNQLTKYLNTHKPSLSPEKASSLAQMIEELQIKVGSLRPMLIK